ncbi:glutamate-ammonia-ligase adenylyltransferase [Planctomycetota bacterium]|nr:glutamate-ammonia-ligase adenylyltransferase [Planctomycetota bacterium]
MLAERGEAFSSTLPDQDGARRDLLLILAACESQAATFPIVALEHLLRLGQGSRAALDTALGDLGRFVETVRLSRARTVLGKLNLRRELDAEVLATGGDREARRAAACRFKRWQDARINLGDLTGALSFRAVVAELSDLADTLIQWAVDEAVIATRHRFAGIDAATRFAVLGMGKLGGRELNYSSDIDLIFLYEPVVGATDPNGGDDLHTAFCRLGTEIIRILDEPTASGRMYRVDLRLRPEGDRGELALSRRETVDYYWTVGRPWERQALIKARCLAGALAVGEAALADLIPWVYPADPPIEVLDEARSMRRRIEERSRTADLKTGAGGIRDIEFLVQYFQLLYGGRNPELRNRATLPTLRTLATRRILPVHHADELERHYLWLRTAEHRLQQWMDRQEHEVPNDPEQRLRLAWRCGATGPAAVIRFDSDLEHTRSRVRMLAARHFLAVGEEQDAALALVVRGEADAKLAQRLLKPVGFRDVAAAAGNLARLAREPFFVLTRDRTERSLAALLPLLLHLIGDSPEPDQTLSNLVRIVDGVGGRATFFDLLAQRPKALQLFIGFAGWANFLVDLFGQHPGLPDEVVDALATRPKPATALRGEAIQLAQGLADPSAPLAFLAARELAVTAIHDLDGWSIDLVGERLTVLAEAVTGPCLARAIHERGKTWGIPLSNGRPSRFAVIGLGKLGGRELSYASDMDVLFVCDPGGTCPKVDRDGEEFWQRVAHDLTRMLGESRLYELDARLRPWGDQSDAVTTTATLDRYWSEPRELWERLAMVRATVLAGDPRLGAEVVELLHERALAPPRPADAAAQVRDMRRRLEETAHGRDHLKRGWGGYVDHEFIAQYHCLGIAEPPPRLSTADTLRFLAERGRIPVEAADQLIPGLHRLRFAESRMRLATGKAVSSLPTDHAGRLAIARRCGYAAIADLDLDLHLARETARYWFDRLIR